MMDIDNTALIIHQTAVDHGFWDKPRNLGEMLMLVTSELAECLEEDRERRPAVWFRHQPKCDRGQVAALFGNDPDLKFIAAGDGCTCTPKPEGALVEIADAIIRLFDTGHDMASRTRFTVSEVIAMKMAYNAQREHMHGKAY